MKKIVCLLMFLFLAGGAFAFQTTFKENYRPGETLIAEISGNIIDNIKAADFIFYSGDDFNPIQNDVTKINSKYYIYAVLPLVERNYTLNIRNLHYLEQGQEKYSSKQFNFSVSGNSTLFSVKPGFIFSTGNFSVDITSNIKDIVVKSIFLNSSKEISVKEARTEKLSFSSPAILSTLYLSSDDTSYEIPVYIMKQSRPVNTSLPQISLDFSEAFLNLSVIKNQNFEFSVELINTGQATISNINISSDLLTIYTNNISLDSEESIDVKFLIKSNQAGIKSGYLRISGDVSLEIPVYINTVENIEEYINITPNDNAVKNCSQLSGDFCASSESCKGNWTLTADYVDKLCCIGSCEELSSSSSGSGKWIALIVIVIILIGGGIFVYKKAKMKKMASQDFFKKKDKEFAERFSPKSEEVEHKLDKS